MTADDRESQVMRHMLRANGIVLDDPKQASAAARPPRSQSVEHVDRDEVRAALLAAGAPARDLEWLTESCPSLTAARAYRTTEGVPLAPQPEPAPDARPDTEGR